MSILIKGMDMPRACAFCELYEADTYWCRGAKKEVLYSSEDDKLAEFCPLMEIPTPHGRLIDADALIRYKERLVKDADKIEKEYWYVVDVNYINSMPTIIEAEDE